MKTSIKVILIILGIIIIATSSYSAGKNSAQKELKNSGTSYSNSGYKGYVSMDKKNNSDKNSKSKSEDSDKDSDEDSGFLGSVKGWFADIKDTVSGWFDTSDDATSSKASDNENINDNECGIEPDKDSNNNNNNNNNDNNNNNSKDKNRNKNYWNNRDYDGGFWPWW